MGFGLQELIYFIGNLVVYFLIMQLWVVLWVVVGGVVFIIFGESQVGDCFFVLMVFEVFGESVVGQFVG